MQNFQLWTIDILQIKSVWKSWQGLRNSQLTADTHVSLDDVSRMSMKRQRERQNQKYKAICFCHKLIEVNFSSSIKFVFETHHACSLGALGSKEVRKEKSNCFEQQRNMIWVPPVAPARGGRPPPLFARTFVEKQIRWETCSGGSIINVGKIEFFIYFVKHIGG